MPFMHNNVGQTRIFALGNLSLYSATCCPNVFELNEQFAKCNVFQLAVKKIDLNGYRRDVSTFQAQDWKDFVMEFCIGIREWKVPPRVLRNVELLELGDL